MSDPALSLENPFRPIYEFYSIAAWATSAALMGVSAYVAEYPSTPFLLFGAICLLMMARQIPKVVELLRVQRKLDGEALQFMTREELREICKERPDSIFLGFGFNWSQAQRQLVHTIVRSDPERLAPHGDTLMGQRWMQGLGKPQPIFQPIDHNAGHTLLAGTTRAGKALPMAARIHTPQGWITMAEVKVGTLVSTPDGGVAPVSGVFPQGELDTYHLHFNDGRVVEASGDHLWEIHHKHWNGKYKPGKSRAGKATPRVLTTLDLRDQILRNKGTFCVPFARPVAKPHAELPIPPYVLGVLLGDGLMGKGNRLMISSADPELIARVATELSSEFTIQKSAGSKYDYSIGLAPSPDRPKSGRLPGGRYVTHPLKRAVVSLGLDECRSWEKFIPACYLEASIEQRVALLQGIMDTDGTVSTRGSASITSTSLQLVQGVQQLVWSLGGRAVLRKRATPKYTYQGEKRMGRPAYKLSVELADSRMAFSLKRKLERCPDGSRRKFRTGLAVTKIVPARRTECQCIKVDHPDELFITDHYIVTHNTRMLDSLITQAVFRGETVIILDPKGDKDLMECARQACIADGRAEDFVYFHPAFPDKSWRIDPLRNFNRATELASRIASLIPSETGADPFTAFGQMQLTNIANGILLIDEKPTLKKILTCFEGGMPHLVKSAILSYCRKTFADRGDEWEEALKRAMEGAKPDINDHATRHARFYRDYVAKHAPSQELQGLISSFTHDATHYGKMIASLLPVLTMLTSGVLGDLLSPDSEDLRDPRPITDFSRAIHNKQVVYIGLDSLSDKFVGSAIGAMFLADLTAVAGDRYNYGKDLQPVNIYVDEAAELANDPFIAMLNKAGGSKARITVATQTLGDFTSRLGSDAKSRMVLGNLNNVVALRLIDGPTQEYITETFSKTVVRHVEYSQSAKAETDEPFIFSGTTNEALKETEVALVDPQMLGALPNLEFFARISGGRLVKARIPILKSAA
jgi:conjugal transfer pilus assembly protein TraD